MTLYLAADEVERAAAAIDRHGYGDFFPSPPEWQILRMPEYWDSIRDHVCSLDLDTYRPYSTLRIYAPKSKFLVRPVQLLHPYDLLILTAMVLALRDAIEQARDPVENKRVLAFRAPKDPHASSLFEDTSGHAEFSRTIRTWGQDAPSEYIGVTDISDFFPRIYRHRLENALEELAGKGRARDMVRCLEKILMCLTLDQRSYGIPVGPAFSWLLGEAVLIDLDSYLISEGVQFVRMVDDIGVRGRSESEVREVLSRIGQFLDKNHNLSLNSGKTRVTRASEVEAAPGAHEAQEAKDAAVLQSIVLRDPDDGYDTISYEELTPEQKRMISGLNLVQMLKSAVESDPIDYGEVSFILRQSSVLRNSELIPIVLQNLDKLGVVAHSVAMFFTGFPSLEAKKKQEIGGELLAQVRSDAVKRGGEFSAVWLLSVFERDPEWNHAAELGRTLREAQSPAVRRQAAIALAASGKRGDVLSVKELIQGQPELVRTACLLAARGLARDERGHWLRSLGLADPLERACSKFSQT